MCHWAGVGAGVERTGQREANRCWQLMEEREGGLVRISPLGNSQCVCFQEEDHSEGEVLEI